ncbi:MAG: ATP-grasp domain-containing protein [Candidatus Pacebacteria bacterium]|nr:ATP-grasp domain-containing protein [Candidatus Paceibacterota bacterium]
MKKSIVIILGSMKYLLDYARLLNDYKSDFKLLVCDLDQDPKVSLPENAIYLPVSLTNPFEQIVDYCQKNHYLVKGVINRKDYFEILHAQLSEKYQVIGPIVSAVETLSDKTKLHRLMDKIGLAEFRPKAVVTSLIEVEKHLDQFNFPIVVKARFGAKSRGVYTINVSSDFQAVKKEFIEKTGNNETEDILVEEFIFGDQLSPISYVSNDGKLKSLGFVDIVTAREMGQKNLQLVFRSLPSKHSKTVLEKIDEILQMIIDATGLKSVALHPEFFVVGEKVYLIEINVRLGGFRRSLLKSAYGIDMNKVGFELAMGLTISDQKQTNNSSTVGEIWSDHSGVVNELKIPNSPYLSNVIYTKQVGDKYIAPPREQIPLAIFFVKASQDSLKIAKELRENTLLEIV